MLEEKRWNRIVDDETDSAEVTGGLYKKFRTSAFTLE